MFSKFHQQMIERRDAMLAAGRQSQAPEKVMQEISLQFHWLTTDLRHLEESVLAAVASGAATAV